MSTFEPAEMTALRKENSALRARVNQLENEAAQRRGDDSVRKAELDERDAALTIKARAIDEFVRAFANVQNYTRVPGA